MKFFKKILFGVQEIIWLFVHGIEDWLYPYRDRPIESLYDDYEDESVNEVNYLKYQIESANERIQRLQHEMLEVQSTIEVIQTNESK
jgi:hypothetical protein|tara:strand:- start:631 stop:891 length:261 start_codon:yes stop_codon:yes gene_type:complete